MQSLDWNGTDFAGRMRRGSVLLALLMGIVILMALYFIDMRAIFRPGGRPSVTNPARFCRGTRKTGWSGRPSSSSSPSRPSRRWRRRGRFRRR